MKTSVFVTLLLVSAAIAHAQQDPAAPRALSLGGTTQYDGWVNFNPTNFPGTGSFPGSGTWQNPLGSNAAGSGDATLRKIANGVGGGPYIASNSIYSGGFSGVPNTLGGTLGVDDSTLVSGLKTVAFQLEIGEAYGYDLYNRAAPTLAYTYVPSGGSGSLTVSNVAATFGSRLAHVDTGATFTDPTTGNDEKLYNNLYGLQWDLSGVAGTVTGLTVSFRTVQHSQIYALQLDQSNQQYAGSILPAPVPEPASLAAFGLGAAALLRRRRRG